MEHLIIDCETNETASVTLTADELAARESDALIEQERQATEQTATTNDTTLKQRSDAALVDLRAYNALTAPTNAQTVAAVKLLCRVCIALIRLQLRKLDDVS